MRYFHSVICHLNILYTLKGQMLYVSPVNIFLYKKKINHNTYYHLSYQTLTAKALKQIFFA